MSKGFFITATDTSVGKTFVAEALARAMTETGIRVGVMKPVETGCMREETMPGSLEATGALRPSDALRLKAAARSEAPLELINPYRFSAPLAPSIAASEAGETIELGVIKARFDELARDADTMIVEGAGGIMVPLNYKETTLDLMVMLALPVIIVAPSRLGCINHTLLTYNAATGAGLTVAAVILNQPDELVDESTPLNASELRGLGLPIKKELPFSPEGKLSISPVIFSDVN
ncbi:Dethiobiotin synthetase [hydrothermal vent metagenome]|uniref:Dethiobiotin synthetase n=1 Tax=hydrothermal vent metagenome TaxID=652676 RepID=A0A3B0UTJ5_9ZZZZ